LSFITEGDWEEVHEKLAEIAEQSRICRRNYNNDSRIESDDRADLDLEASISQLVLEDYDDPILEDGETTKPQPLVWVCISLSLMLLRGVKLLSLAVLSCIHLSVNIESFIDCWVDKYILFYL